MASSAAVAEPNDIVVPTKLTLVTNRTTGIATKRVSRDSKWRARFRDPNGRARSDDAPAIWLLVLAGLQPSERCGPRV
jgi:hypothetical protein